MIWRSKMKKIIRTTKTVYFCDKCKEKVSSKNRYTCVICDAHGKDYCPQCTPKIRCIDHFNKERNRREIFMICEGCCSKDSIIKDKLSMIEKISKEKVDLTESYYAKCQVFLEERDKINSTLVAYLKKKKEMISNE